MSYKGTLLFTFENETSITSYQKVDPLGTDPLAKTFNQELGEPAI